MKTEKITEMLNGLAGYATLNSGDQLSIIELALGAAQTEYNRLISAALTPAGKPIVRIYYHEIGSDIISGKPELYTIIGFEDLANKDDGPAQFYLSAWSSSRMVAMVSSKTGGIEAAMTSLEFRLVKMADRSGEFGFPLNIFTRKADWDTYSQTLIMPELNALGFKSADEAREFIHLEQSRQLTGAKMNMDLLSKANAQCDNIMGRTARNVGKLLAEISMYEQQAISVARESALKQCQTLQARSGKLASNWGAW